MAHGASAGVGVPVPARTAAVRRKTDTKRETASAFPVPCLLERSRVRVGLAPHDDRKHPPTVETSAHRRPVHKSSVPCTYRKSLWTIHSREVQWRSFLYGNLLYAILHIKEHQQCGLFCAGLGW